MTMTMETTVYLLTHVLAYLLGGLTVLVYALILSNRRNKQNGSTR